MPGENLYILGNVPEFGNWDIKKGFGLKWHQNHDWSNVMKLGYDQDTIIEYKYVVHNQNNDTFKWENGKNRILDFSIIKPAKEELFLKEVWEHKQVKLRIKYDCGEKKYLSICAMIPGLNFYFKNPARMIKMIKRDPYTNIKTEFWEKEFHLKYDVKKFRYRYILSNVEDDMQIWEREPDRKFNLEAATEQILINRITKNQRNENNLYKTILTEEKQALLSSPTSSHDAAETTIRKDKACLNNDTPNATRGWNKDYFYSVRKHNKFVKIDFNFVAEFAYNQINDNIYIGPYPQTLGEIEALSNTGIRAVLNLQTSYDMRHRSVDWDQMLKFYEKQDIKAINFQIIDMNKEDMELKAFKVATTLKELIDTYKKVYVHCTAGIGRAPQTVVAYLMFFENYDIEDAIRFVKEKRPISWINREAMIYAYLRYKDQAHKQYC